MTNKEDRIVVIAEAGVNYNGDIGIAKKMVAVAEEAGADICKFQTGIGHNCTSKFAEKAEYQKTNTNDPNGEESQLEMGEKLQLPFDTYPDLIDCCKAHKLEFLSTPFDLESAKFLHKMGMHRWKIPSGEITNLPYLRLLGSFGEPIILSTGMSNLQEVEKAIDILTKNGAGKITLLHCNTDYPTPFEDANLRAMETLKKEFGLDVGYSDHTIGIEVAIAAAALGAKVIEKHFTLDRNMPGPDQICSTEPGELKQMITSIRNIEKALGTGVKEPTKSEIKNMNIARKSIVAEKPIKKGEKFTEENIAVKRPGNGVSPMEWDNVLGCKACRDFEADELIVLE